MGTAIKKTEVKQMDEQYFERKEGTLEVDMRKNAVKGYCVGRKGFAKQMEKLDGFFN